MHGTRGSPALFRRVGYSRAYLTFGQCDLSDAVALSKPHRHGADQVSGNLLLSVLFPAQGQGRVAACGDQVLIKQAVLRA